MWALPSLLLLRLLSRGLNLLLLLPLRPHSSLNQSIQLSLK
jgi:hypothetical protein